MKSLLVASVFTMLSLNVEANRNGNRERRQEARIAQGVNSGALTNREARRLAKGQKKIDSFQSKAMADGELSVKEKARLEKMQDRQNRKIYRQKHDEQTRGSQPTIPGEPGLPNTTPPESYVGQTE